MAVKKNFTVGMASSPAMTESNRMKEMEANRAYNFKFIPKEKIVPNPLNDKYSQADIDDLRDSILDNGLRHNLSVIYDADNDNYRLISGERRFRAISSMSEKDYASQFPGGIPCKVEKSTTSEVDEEIMLITANSDVREKTQEERRWEVLRLKDLYEIKKANGEITNIGKSIAEKLHISERQVVKYMNTGKLIPELSDMLDANGIKIDEASSFAKLSIEGQNQILALLKEKGGVDQEELKVIKQKEKEKKELQVLLSKTEQELSKKDEMIEELERQVAFLQKKSQANPKKDMRAKLEELKAEKDRAEKDKKRLADNLAEMRQQQKDKENRNINASDEELKRIKDITKAEQTISLLEQNVAVLKKDVVVNDEALKERLNMLIGNINKILGRD